MLFVLFIKRLPIPCIYRIWQRDFGCLQPLQQLMAKIFSHVSGSFDLFISNIIHMYPGSDQTMPGQCIFDDFCDDRTEDIIFMVASVMAMEANRLRSHIIRNSCHCA